MHFQVCHRCSLLITRSETVRMVCLAWLQKTSAAKTPPSVVVLNPCGCFCSSLLTFLNFPFPSRAEHSRQKTRRCTRSVPLAHGGWLPVHDHLFGFPSPGVADGGASDGEGGRGSEAVRRSEDGGETGMFGGKPHQTPDGDASGQGMSCSRLRRFPGLCSRECYRCLWSSSCCCCCCCCWWCGNGGGNVYWNALAPGDDPKAVECSGACGLREPVYEKNGHKRNIWRMYTDGNPFERKNGLFDAAGPLCSVPDLIMK